MTLTLTFSRSKIYIILKDRISVVRSNMYVHIIHDVFDENNDILIQVFFCTELTFDLAVTLI